MIQWAVLRNPHNSSLCHLVRPVRRLPGCTRPSLNCPRSCRCRVNDRSLKSAYPSLISRRWSWSWTPLRRVHVGSFAWCEAENCPMANIFTLAFHANILYASPSEACLARPHANAAPVPYRLATWRLHTDLQRLSAPTGLHVSVST